MIATVITAYTALNLHLRVLDLILVQKSGSTKILVRRTTFDWEKFEHNTYFIALFEIICIETPKIINTLNTRKINLTLTMIGLFVDM